MSSNAIWRPPSLCGCELKIVADFTDDSISDGVTYRHPIPFTIQQIDIVNVCNNHRPNTISMVDTDHLFDVDSYTGKLKQTRGYLKYPISNPTPAECLYTFLSKYGGQTHSYPCGCSAHQFIDENKFINYLHHPRHTKKCFKHAHDDVDMRRAKTDFKAAQEKVAEG